MNSHWFLGCCVLCRSLGTLPLNTLSARCAPVSRNRMGTTPSHPLQVNAQGGDGFITVSFRAPEKSGLSQIKEYVVTSNPGNHKRVWRQPPEGWPNELSVKFNALIEAQAYSFQVIARNTFGAGPPSLPSNEKIFARHPSAPPAAPTVNGSAVLRPKGECQVQLKWTPSASDGGDPISCYLLRAYEVVRKEGQPRAEYRLVPETPTLTLDGQIGANVFGLTDGKTYVFRVASQNGKGKSSESPMSEELFVKPVLQSARTLAPLQLSRTPSRSPSRNGSRPGSRIGSPVVSSMQAGSRDD
jgi:hypothetical protein